MQHSRYFSYTVSILRKNHNTRFNIFGLLLIEMSDDCIYKRILKVRLHSGTFDEFYYCPKLAYDWKIFFEKLVKPWEDNIEKEKRSSFI